jgi:hypothetical protein
LTNLEAVVVRVINSLVFALAAYAQFVVCQSALACDTSDRSIGKKPVEMLRSELKANPTMAFEKDKDGCTLLLKALREDRLDLAALLLASHADVDARDQDGWTSLHMAAGFGDKEQAGLLLANRADVNAVAPHGPRPTFVGVAGTDAAGHITITRKQINKADDFDWNIAGWTPLALAALEGDRDLVSMLLVHSAKVNAATSNGWTPLRWAVYKGNKEVVALLRQHGGNGYAQQSSADTGPGLIRGESSLWAWKGSECTVYLRFYSSGTVIATCVVGDGVEDLPWFNMPYETETQYSVTGTSVRFSFPGCRGVRAAGSDPPFPCRPGASEKAIDYEGLVAKSSLQLHWFSHIDNRQGTMSFEQVAQHVP